MYGLETMQAMNAKRVEEAQAARWGSLCVGDRYGVAG